MDARAAPRGVDLHEDRGGMVIGACCFLMCMAIISTALRIYSRSIARLSMGLDDWFCLVGLPFSLLPAAFDIALVKYGFGKHMAVVPKGDLTHYAYLLYIVFLFYNLGLSFFKLSLLALYVRVFRVVKWLRIACYIIGAMVVAWTIATKFVLIFRCNPINYAWLATPQQQADACIPQKSIYFAQSIPTIFFDIAILSLPIKLIGNLQMPRGEKAGVIGVFLLGSLVTVISILRFAYTLIGKEQDMTYDLVALGMWSAAEPVVGQVCCSLLTYGPLIKRVMGKMGYKSSKGYSKTYGSGQPSIFRGNETTIGARRSSFGNADWASDQFELTGNEFNTGTHDDHDSHHSRCEAIKVKRDFCIEHGLP